MRVALGSLICIIAGLACNKGPTPTRSPESAPAPTFADQVARGGEVYGAQCASCHGSGGEGGKAPRVVGLAEGALPLSPREGAKRTSEFVTVADIATFVVATMPPFSPGSLPEADYWAVLAFDLSANGIELDQPLTPALASTLTVPR